MASVMTWKPREIEPWGGYVFVYARPRSGDWRTCDGTFNRTDANCEFRPCLLRGHDDGQRIFVAGSQYGYNPGDFEIAGDVPVMTP